MNRRTNFPFRSPSRTEQRHSSLCEVVIDRDKPYNSTSAHLLVSVYLSASGLGQQKYDLGTIDSSRDEYFRIGRFLTGLRSLSSIRWETATVFIQTDEDWSHLTPILREKVLEILPEASFKVGRLSSPSEWRGAAEKYQKDSVIYLHCNDDHAFVSESTDDFYKMVWLMSNSPHLKVGAVTHHPEMMGVLSRKFFKRGSPNHALTAPITYALGTTLVRGDFFKSWWLASKWEEDEIVVRPDNPLGRSVVFEPVEMIVPPMEQIRHLDGYSHIGLFSPLTPLRNTVKFLEGDENLGELGKWQYGYWPSRLFSKHGTGVDMHRVYVNASDPLFRQIQIGVARLQATWALRVSVRNGLYSLLNSNRISVTAVAPAMLISLLSPTVLKNLIDYVIDIPLVLVLRVVNRMSPKLDELTHLIWYLGTFRAVSVKRRPSGFGKQPRT